MIGKAARDQRAVAKAGKWRTDAPLGPIDPGDIVASTAAEPTRGGFAAGDRQFVSERRLDRRGAAGGEPHQHRSRHAPFPAFSLCCPSHASGTTSRRAWFPRSARRLPSLIAPVVTVRQTGGVQGG